MNEIITVRPATIHDFKAIAQLHADNWKKYYRGILSDHYLTNEVDADRLQTWEKRLTTPDGNQRILIACRNNELVGFCCFLIDDDPLFGTLIDNLHVSPFFHKNGIGKKLLHESAKIISQEATHLKIYLWVYESNLNARAAYNSIGGTIFETIEKRNEDGSYARCCRCVWNQVQGLLSATAT